MAIGDILSLVQRTTIPNGATSSLLHFLLPAGTIDGIKIDLESANASSDVVFNFYIDGVAQYTTELTVASGTNEITTTGLAVVVTNDNWGTISIELPFTSGALSGVTAIGAHITYVTQTVNLTGAQTVAGVKTFSSDPIIPDEAYDATAWNGSLEPPTKNAVRDKIESMGSSIPFTAASASGAAYLDFAEDTDNGSNRVRLQGAASTADVTVTLPAATDTLVGKDTTDTLTNKSISGSANTITNVSLATGVTGNLPVANLNSGTSASSSTFWRGDGTWSTPAGSGTVTNTGGNLTSNSVVLGAGTTDTKVVAGITTNGTAQLVLGVNTTTLGSVKMFGNTSGDVTVSPNAVAGTATALTLPATSDTLVGKATTDTFTNKTYDTEGTGNVFTYPERIWLPAGGTNGSTAATMWDLPTSNAPTPTAVNGTNIHKGVLSFADSGAQTAQTTLLLPADWTGNIDAKILWYSSSNSGNCKWFVYTAFTDIAAGATDDPSFNTAQTVTTAAPGTANRIQTSSISSLTTTGATAGYLFHIKVGRDGTDGSDTIAAAALLYGVEIVWRRTI